MVADMLPSTIRVSLTQHIVEHWTRRTRNEQQGWWQLRRSILVTGAASGIGGDSPTVCGAGQFVGGFVNEAALAAMCRTGCSGRNVHACRVTDRPELLAAVAEFGEATDGGSTSSSITPASTPGPFDAMAWSTSSASSTST